MTTQRFFAATLLLFCAGFASAQKPDDILKAAAKLEPDQLERIKEYKKYSSDKDVRQRADQQERLAGLDHPEAAMLLVTSGLRDDTYRVYEKAIWALSRHKSEGSVGIARAFLKSGSDEVRAGCALALSKMTPKPEGVAAEIASMLQSGARDDLKVSFCQALGFFGDKVATPALRSALKGSETVVIAAADALGLVKDPESASDLIGMLRGGTWRTQVAAVDALALIRSKSAVGPLIDYLEKAEGKTREDAKVALQKITGRTFGMRHEDWRGWWEGAETDFKVPPPVDPATLEAKEKDVSDGYGRTHKVTEYHRIKTYSKRLLFVLDISSSMNEVIKVKRGYDAVDKRFQSSPKIDLARYELKSVLKTLDKDTWFNVMCFETEIKPWKKEPVLATDSSIAEAVQWVEKQKPIDGFGTSRRPGAGGPQLDENGWQLGRTNTYGALKFVYGRPVKPGRGVTGNPKPSGNSDTVFFLTDGTPTEGETTNVAEILADVALWNKTARLTIHTIGMSESTGMRDLLHGLAEKTGGKCVFVGE